MHPLVRDTSPQPPAPDLLAFAELPARLLWAAAEAAGETGDPRRLQEFEAVIPAPRRWRAAGSHRRLLTYVRTR
ncbi:hypothetical protein [Streptomyces sp. ALI-76-A]|uniref:hypothetical protein n=1 Tax=Streptomyces sp. ALI-76-A TaxID=3025736 RepID=UPI00256F49F9|nr:hypothetical protein [Streptomyces sp. ALI-76-A]MDL5198861.1 hypothetical protein [Streptomyces sp. ALI-76-A]